jgi:hypothetical protein
MAAVVRAGQTSVSILSYLVHQQGISTGSGRTIFKSPNIGKPCSLAATFSKRTTFRHILNIKKQMILKFSFGLLALTTIISCSNGETNNKAKNSLNSTEQKKETSNPVTLKKFKEADNTAVFTTKFVITDNKEITEVHHDEDDGAWQFFSNDNFADFSKVSKIVGLGQITKIDSTLFEIADMPTGNVARRKYKGDKWVIEKKQ